MPRPWLEKYYSLIGNLLFIIGFGGIVGLFFGSAWVSFILITERLL